jgi:TrmH family RNA methyltransferase
MDWVTSRQNAMVKRFRDLARAPGSGASDEILLDGAHLLQEAIACGVAIDVAAFLGRQLVEERSPWAQIAEDVTRQGGRVIRVTEEVLAAISPVEHPSGVVALGHARPSTVGAAFSATSGTKDVPLESDSGSAPLGSDFDPQLVLVLAGLQDPGNVGAIVRTAAACGATGVVTMDGSANPFGWKALRGAMGGTFRLPIAVRSSLPDVAGTARATGVRLVAAVPRGGTPLPRVDLRSATAILLGGEGSGVSASAVSAAAETVSIPMRASAESLNVAVAAGLILYEAMRQRQEERS